MTTEPSITTLPAMHRRAVLAGTGALAIAGGAQAAEAAASAWPDVSPVLISLIDAHRSARDEFEAVSLAEISADDDRFTRAEDEEEFALDRVLDYRPRNMAEVRCWARYVRSALDDIGWTDWVLKTLAGEAT